MPFQPVQAAEACIRRSRRLLTLAVARLPYSKIKNDLRRAALVTLVSGIDSYMHWLVYRRISELRNIGDLPKALAKLDVPFTELADLADSVLTARASNVDCRPWVKVKNVMQHRLLRETFQGYEQVGTALTLAGIEKAWTRIGEHLGESTTEIKTRLNALVRRRNQIVHEGDITRASRPRQLRYNDLAHQAISDDVDWVESLVVGIEAVVQVGNP